MIKKCPLCKQSLGKNDILYAEMEYTTTVPVEFDRNRELVGDIDITAGYTSLCDFINSMMVESKKKPKIVGCNHCLL